MSLPNGAGLSNSLIEKKSQNGEISLYLKFDTSYCLLDLTQGTAVVEEQTWSLSPIGLLSLSFGPTMTMGIRSSLPSISKTPELKELA